MRNAILENDLKDMWIKQLFNGKVWDFAVAFRDLWETGPWWLILGCLDDRLSSAFFEAKLSSPFPLPGIFQNQKHIYVCVSRNPAVKVFRTKLS